MGLKTGRTADVEQTSRSCKQSGTGKKKKNSQIRVCYAFIGGVFVYCFANARKHTGKQTGEGAIIFKIAPEPHRQPSSEHQYRAKRDYDASELI